MTTVRIFLPTYRRPQMLPRALASLRRQTFTDWVCELHNDDPTDPQPAELVKKLNDSRITLHQHTENWGPIKTFNHAFKGGAEPFLSLLEDDNWWEPEFLETALAALHAHPDAVVAWTNMFLHREEPEGKWTETGSCVWDVANTVENTPQRLRWPVPRQCFDGLHSNGAMVCRTAASREACVPEEIPFDIIEPVRERLLAGTWLFLPRPLANFLITRRSARAGDRSLWASSQLLVAASYLQAVQPGAKEIRAIWRTLREQSPPATNLLIMVSWVHKDLRRLLRGSLPEDWIRFIVGAIRHPLTVRDTLRHFRKQETIFETMLTGARQRSAENPARVDSPFLLRKEYKVPAQ